MTLGSPASPSATHTPQPATHLLLHRCIPSTAPPTGRSPHSLTASKGAPCMYLDLPHMHRHLRTSTYCTVPSISLISWSTPFQCLRSCPRSIQRAVHHYDRLEISHSLSSHLPSPATAEAVVRAVSDDPRWAQVPYDWPSRASPPKEIIHYGNDKSHAASCQWHSTAAPHREAVAARQALTAWKKSPLRAISESGSCTGGGGRVRDQVDLPRRSLAPRDGPNRTSVSIRAVVRLL
jgi:hypothetical protein